MNPCLFGSENELGLVTEAKGEIRPAPTDLASAIIDAVAERYRHLPSPPPARRIFLENGACVYADVGGHPEIASAECSDPVDLAAQMIGLRMMLTEAAEAIGQIYGIPIRLIANNVDYALGGARTFGNHFNVLTAKLPLEHLAGQLAPLLAAMPVLAGTGKVSFAPGSCGFELSQRAGFMACVMGKHTQDSRAIFTCKDEPLCAQGVRVHLISLDTVISPWQLVLVPAVIALTVKAIEAGVDIAGPVSLADPIKALHTVSCDPSLNVALPLQQGRTATALDIHDHYHRAATQVVTESSGIEWAGRMIGLWGDVIANLRQDPFREVGRLDWVTKLVVFTQELERRHLAWDEFSRWIYTLASVRRLKASFPELDINGMANPVNIRRSALGTLESHFLKNGLSWKDFPPIWQAANGLCRQCLSYHTLRPDKGIDAEERFPSLVTAERVNDLRTHPPKGTRASVRGEAIRTARPGATAWWTFVDQDSRRLVMEDAFGVGASWQEKDAAKNNEVKI